MGGGSSSLTKTTTHNSTSTWERFVFPNHKAIPFNPILFSFSKIEKEEDFEANEDFQKEELELLKKNKQFMMTKVVLYDWINKHKLEKIQAENLGFFMNVFDLKINKIHSMLEIEKFQIKLTPQLLKQEKSLLFSRNQSSITPFLLIFKKISSAEQLIDLIPTLNELYLDNNKIEIINHTRRCENYIHCLLENNSLGIGDKIRVLTKIREIFNDYEKRISNYLNEYQLLPFTKGIYCLSKSTLDLNKKLELLNLLSPKEGWIKTMDLKMNGNYNNFRKEQLNVILLKINPKPQDKDDWRNNFETYQQVFNLFNRVFIKALVEKNQYDVINYYYEKELLDFKCFFCLFCKPEYKSDIFSIFYEQNSEISLNFTKKLFKDFGKNLYEYNYEKDLKLEESEYYISFLITRLINQISTICYKVYCSSTKYSNKIFNKDLFQIELPEFFEILVPKIFFHAKTFQLKRFTAERFYYFLKKALRKNIKWLEISYLNVIIIFQSIMKKLNDEKSWSLFVILTMEEIFDQNLVLFNFLLSNYFIEAIQLLEYQDYEVLLNKIIYKFFSFSTNRIPLFILWQQIFKNNKSKITLKKEHIMHLFYESVRLNDLIQIETLIKAYPYDFKGEIVKLHQEEFNTLEECNNYEKSELNDEEKVFEKGKLNNGDENYYLRIQSKVGNLYDIILKIRFKLDVLKIFLDYGIQEKTFFSDDKNKHRIVEIILKRNCVREFFSYFFCFKIDEDSIFPFNANFNESVFYYEKILKKNKIDFIKKVV